MKTVWIRLQVDNDYDDVADELVVEDFLEVKHACKLNVYPLKPVLHAAGALAEAVRKLEFATVLGLSKDFKAVLDAVDNYDKKMMELMVEMSKSKQNEY